MKTNLLIIGKGDDIITMILDNFDSRGLNGNINIFNNLDLPVLSKIEHPNFEINIKTSVDFDAFDGLLLGVYKPEIKKLLVTKYNLLDSDKLIDCIHETFNSSVTSSLGIGCLINSNVTIAAQTSVGNFVSINRGVTIGHHVIIEDFVSINPGSNIAGHCFIGESTTIGMGTQVLNGVRIGKNTVIGAGSIVTKDIPDGVVAWGQPCKVIRQNK